MIYGVDVSNYQADEFPLELNDGTPIDFVIIQVTRGLAGWNHRWMDQAAWARENGLAVGFYHFGIPGDTKEQAARFHETLGGLRPGETLWYDWENSVGAAPTNAEKDEFIQELKRLRPSRKVGLYCNVDYWKNWDTTDYYGDALWIASWSNPAKDPPIQASWTIHQFSDGGGKLDHDRANFGHREDMKVWGGKPPSDTEIIARGVAALTEMARAEAALAAARYNGLKATLDHVEAVVMELGAPHEAPTADAILDEFARRLES